MPTDNYDADSVYDFTDCPDCDGRAEVVELGEGYFVYCPNCGRILKRTRDTVEEAVYAYKRREEVDYN